MANTDPNNWFLPANPFPRNPHFTAGNEVIALIDGEEYMSHLAARMAKMLSDSELYLSGWRVTPHVLLEPLASPPNPNFLDQIKDIISRRGILLRSMLWYVAGTYLVRINHPGENLAFTKGVISVSPSPGRLGTGILDERLPSKPASHHQKFLVLQSESHYWAYVGGIDLCVDRWDTPSHNSPPQRQKEFVEGWHDVQCALRGPAVAQVWENFKQRWDDRTPPTRWPSPIPIVSPAPIRSKPPSPATYGTQQVQLLRTLACGGVYSFATRGEQTSRMALERAAERAEHYIYIEEQYLWPCSLVDKLRIALAKNRDLKLIVLLARDYDMPPPLSTVHYEMRDEAIRTISGGRKGQLFIYHLEQLSTKLPIYVHSKLMIVDDCFVAVGSTNVGKRSFTTDSELHIGVVDAATAPGVMAGRTVTICRFAKQLRLKLWQEHLGITDPSRLDDPIASISLWPDWSKSTPRKPSRVHHAVCHYPISDSTTIGDWIKGLRLIKDMLKPPPPWENIIPEAIDILEKVEINKNVVLSPNVNELLLGRVWLTLKRIIRDYLMNIETTC